MKHPSDVIAKATHLGVDDYQFKAEQKRKRAPKAPLPDLPDGPCCARCRNWHKPAKHDDFGRCRAIVFDPTARPDARKMLTLDEAKGEFLMGFDFMPTRGFAEGCSKFADANGTQQADTDAMDLSPTTTLRDLVRNRAGEAA